jgi:hypothetical protein
MIIEKDWQNPTGFSLRYLPFQVARWQTNQAGLQAINHTDM